MEDIVNSRSDLAMFCNTGMECTKPLETDIQFMCAGYKLERPEVEEVVPLSLLSIKEFDIEEEEVGILEEEDKVPSRLFSKCCIISAATGNELLDAECFSMEEEEEFCMDDNDK
eukprot:8524707-Ditylum_brightwellii.AAC.1